MAHGLSALDSQMFYRPDGGGGQRTAVRLSHCSVETERERETESPESLSVSIKTGDSRLET